jgi:flagellar protein FlbD
LCLPTWGNVFPGTKKMIQLTRLNHNPLIINADLIKLIENAPDTVLSLVTGEKIVVLESSAQVVDKIVEFRRRILAELPFQMFSSGPSAPSVVRQIPFPAGKS